MILINNHTGNLGNEGDIFSERSFTDMSTKLTPKEAILLNPHDLPRLCIKVKVQKHD